MQSFLFVCTGNICRSPTAEAVFRQKTFEKELMFTCDSAGTYGYHVGEPPDERSIRTAQSFGIEMQDLRARKLIAEDYEKFDYLIAMDKGHKRIMLHDAPKKHHNKIQLLMDYHSGFQGIDVPDPYYGDMEGFQNTFKLIEVGIDALIENFKNQEN